MISVICLKICAPVVCCEPIPYFESVTSAAALLFSRRASKMHNSVSVDAGLGLQILQQLGGINTVMVYALYLSWPQQLSMPMLSMDIVTCEIAS